MKQFAILVLMIFPSLAYAEATVSQTPPHRSDESGAHNTTEHRHRVTGAGQSSRPQHNESDAADDSVTPDATEPDDAQGSPHQPHGSTKPNDGQGI
jgi:hypothetical protein